MSSGIRRPISFRNIRLCARAGGAFDVSFDVECREMRRQPPERGPGSFSAAWLFLKLRSSRTRTDLDEATVLELLAPTKHLPKASAEAVRSAAAERLRLAFMNYGTHDASTMLNAGSASFDLQGGEPEYVTVHKQTIATGAAPGTLTATRDTVALARRAQADGFVYDCRSLSAWRHAKLSSNAADHRAPDGWEIIPSKTGEGVFLQPSPENVIDGPATIEGVVLRWLGDAKAEAPLRLWLFGLEMIYIPEGAFELGDPMGIDGPTGCFHATKPSDSGKAKNWVYKVESEQAIRVTETSDTAEQGLTWDGKGQYGGHGDIPAVFPKGHRAFYIMRRQVTQGEYCDFMNAISGNAKTSRFPYGGQGQYRYMIFKTEGGLRAGTRPDRANNWMSWADAIAWCWWAGLRPMTEFEYEKAARGFAAAVPNEYAWGTTLLERANVIIGDESTGDELVTGNANLDNAYVVLQGGDGGAGPCRDDGFGLPGTPTIEARTQSGYAAFHVVAPNMFVRSELGNAREATGVSYFGVFGLTGNLWEFTISAGHPIGRAFQPVHGDGALNEVGLPKFVDLAPEQQPWPSNDAAGAGFRGGSWYTDATRGRLADRGFGAGLEGYAERSHDTGFRGVHSSPEYDD